MPSVDVTKLVVGLVSLVVACLIIALGARQLEESLKAIKSLDKTRVDDIKETAAEQALLDSNYALQTNWKWVWIIIIILGSLWLLSALALTIRSFNTPAAQKARMMDVMGKYRDATKSQSPMAQAQE